ncbi:MAG: hypothetical protein GY946_22625 [bacterium]|nr:hypothetical protein [bacterium]
MSEKFHAISLELVLVPMIILGVWTLHQTNLLLEDRSVEAAATGDVGPLPDGKVIRVISLGFERLVADLFWVRTTYYIGDSASADANYPAAEALANLVTDIDPHFDSVYVLMSSVLNGLRWDPDAAIALLEKGAQHSNYWRIHFLLGFNYFMDKNDYAAGAKHLQRAVELGGPTYLQLLVSRLYSHGGDPATAMSFIRARLEQEQHPRIKAQLERRLADIWITRDLGLIDKAIAKYRAAHGRDAASPRALVEAGFMKREPLDPKKQPYYIEAGKAACSMDFELLELKR